MKVLLCERIFRGHRKIYVEWLAKISGIEFFCYAPENTGLSDDHFFRCESSGIRPSFKDYLSWVRKIRAIVKENNIDVVHITDGDSIMKYFGLGFSGIGAEKIIITYHHFIPGFARKISYLAMNAAKGSISIAHTDAVRNALSAAGIKDVRVCRYPAFTYTSIAERDAGRCKECFGVPQDVPVIGIVGGMSDYKNIIPFLEMMQNCQEKFHILLCGNGDENFKSQVENAIEPYADNVTMELRRLTDDEYEMAIMASDIVYCLYNHSFDGASGPLTDGVCANKMILSCAHGSLGSIVAENHLGFTAKCTDAGEMLEQTTKALNGAKSFVYDDVAAGYRESLMPEYFQAAYRKIYESVPGEEQ